MNPLFLRSLLFDSASGDANGGGGTPPAGGNAGGDAGNGGGNQPPALTSESVSKMINDAVNGVSKRLTGEHQKTVAELRAQIDAFKPKPVDDGTQPPIPGQQQGQKTPEQLRYERDIEQLRREVEATKKRADDTEKARQATEEQSRKTMLDSRLTQALSKFDLIDGAVGDAFTALRPNLKLTDDGQVVAGDAQLPLDQFLADAMKQRSYMIRTKDVGGTGGAVRGGSGASGGGPAVDLDDIANMSKDKRQNAWKQALALLPK